MTNTILTVPVEIIVAAIKSRHTKGKLFSVDFVKKDGSLRTMNCRTGVKKYLHGGVKTTEGREDLLTVADNDIMLANAVAEKAGTKVQSPYRNINLETIKGARIRGVTYVVEI